MSQTITPNLSVFYGGIKRGRCYQIFDSDGNYIQLKEDDAYQVAKDIIRDYDSEHKKSTSILFEDI